MVGRKKLVFDHLGQMVHLVSTAGVKSGQKSKVVKKSKMVKKESQRAVKCE